MKDRFKHEEKALSDCVFFTNRGNKSAAASSAASGGVKNRVADSGVN